MNSAGGRPPAARLLPALATLVLLLAGARASHAQVIRSYEALDQAAGEGFYSTLGLSLDASGGNVRYTDADFSAAVGYRGEKNFLRFYPAYRVRSQEGTRQQDVRTLHLRHSYFFSEGLRSYAFAQYQSDLALQLDSRVLIGGGMRKRLVELTEGGVELGLGVMWEAEQVTGQALETDVRGANLLVVNGKSGSVDLNFTGFYQPRLDNFRDVRLAFSGTAAVPLRSSLSLTVSLRWLLDTDPPPTVQREDYGMTVGLRYSID
jgi:hypothetical protein